MDLDLILKTYNSNRFFRNKYGAISCVAVEDLRAFIQIGLRSLFAQAEIVHSILCFVPPVDGENLSSDHRLNSSMKCPCVLPHCLFCPG